MNEIDKLNQLPTSGNRTFYKTYPDEKGQTLSAQLPWSHNCLIMRVTDPKAREWFLHEAAQGTGEYRQDA